MYEDKATKEELNEKYDLGFKYALTDEQVVEIEEKYRYPVAQDENITINNDECYLPFGTKYFTWRDMKKQHLNGAGVIWYYDNIGILCGSKGYILVKGQFKTGLQICTMMA